MSLSHLPAHLTPPADLSIPLSSSFYTGFRDYETLMIFFEFLGKSVHYLKYRGSKSTVPSVEKRGTSSLLTPLNELFLVLCRVRCGLMEIDLVFRFKISQSPALWRLTLCSGLKYHNHLFQELLLVFHIYKVFFSVTKVYIDDVLTCMA